MGSGAAALKRKRKGRIAGYRAVAAALLARASLADHPSARAACAAAGVTEGELPAYIRALSPLADSKMISERRTA